MARSRSVEATELDTAPGTWSFIEASASMNLLTVDPVPTPTISPGTTYFNAAWPTSAFSSSCVTHNPRFDQRRCRNYPMSLLPYSLARPFLFGLDPETAHELTLASLERLQRTPLQWAYRNGFVPDPVMLAGLRFPNRVGLAAGLDKNARCIDALGAMGFGFVEVGTVTPKAQPGNPRPRMFRLQQANALINRLGFNNDGLDAFVANVQRSSFRAQGRLLGLNIGKNTATPIEQATADYLTCLDGVYPHADYVTVNISSPNTKNLRALQGDEALDGLLSAVAQRREELATRYGRRVPVFVKIAPDLDDAQVDVIAATLQRHGMDGVVATNTTVARDKVAGLPHAGEAGGLSGGPLLDASNRVIAQLRAALGSGFPIIGVGGVLGAADARSKLRAGADVVQIYTGLIYRGPALVDEIARAFRAEAGVPR
jgi:dihydroorotate dehydrogenase